MTYQQDLARLHRERKARLWPVSQPKPQPEWMITALKTQIEVLERQAAILRAEVRSHQQALSMFKVDPTLRSLKQAVCAVYGLTEEQLLGPGRTKVYVQARRHFAHEARKLGKSLPQIGRFLNRDHTTIMNLLGGWEFEKERLSGPIETLNAILAKDAEPMIG